MNILTDKLVGSHWRRVAKNFCEHGTRGTDSTNEAVAN